jgi:metallo-beta-lactamase family protein
VKITVHGAAGGEVTGSCYLVQSRSARVLVDCGMFQGGREAEARNRAPGGTRCAHLDAVVLTHAHLDHTGRLPLLTRSGFDGPIHATPATQELTGLILRDAAKLQVQDAERQNRKRTRAGEEPIEPLYTPGDVETTLRQLTPAPYHQPVEVAPGIRTTWIEAGHMLGSSSLQLEIEEAGTTRRVVFSGDLGPRGAPILRDFETFHRADLVFLESTYGDHDHRPFAETVDEFVRIVREAVETRGKILVPTFAVGRAQTMMLLLGWMFRTRKVKPFPVFLDSPMAIEATEIYARHVELFDEEMRAYLREGSLRDDLRSLRLTSTAEESKTINDQPGPCLVLAGAGMCNAGRILHHLKHNLWNAGTHVVIVGFQSHGSLGRRLVDGETHVRIHGDVVAVKARIHTLGGFSAHAGQTDLLAWFESLAPARPRVVLTHGEEDARVALAKKIQERHGLRSALPAIGETLTL